MYKKLLAVVTLLLVSQVSASFAKTFPDVFRAGPVYLETPGQVAVVVELPPGGAPKPADFHLMVEGRKVADAGEIKAFEASGKGLAVVICVDVSGSMRGGPLKEAKESLLSLLGVAASRPQDRFALLSFADDARVESSFVSSRQRLSGRNSTSGKSSCTKRSAPPAVTSRAGRRYDTTATTTSRKRIWTRNGIPSPSNSGERREFPSR